MNAGKVLHCCPRCGSKNTVAFPMAHQGGFSVSSSSGFSGGSFAELKSEHQTNLSRMTAPPERPTFSNANVVSGGCLLAIFSFALGTGGGVFVVVAALLAVGGGYGLYKLHLGRREAFERKFAGWQKQRSDWEKSWLCLRCGAVHQ